jgi:predicted MFS family arabinose efflux permease
MEAESRMPKGLLPLLILLVFVVMMDGRVMTAMLPEIAADLDSSVSTTGRATELAPEARGTAISLFAFSLFLGSALGTAFLGQLLSVSGYDAILLVSGVALVMLAVAAPRLTAHPAARAPSPA